MFNYTVDWLKLKRRIIYFYKFDAKICGSTKIGLAWLQWKAFQTILDLGIILTTYIENESAWKNRMNY